MDEEKFKGIGIWKTAEGKQNEILGETSYRKVEHEPLASQKNSHRISRVRDNLSESITGFSPHNISEHVVSWKTRSNFFPNKVSVFIVIYADWWELTQKEERKFEGKGFSDASVQWTKIKSFSIFEKLLQMCFRTILTYDH